MVSVPKVHRDRYVGSLVTSQWYLSPWFPKYVIQEAWEWSVQDYKIAFDRVRRLSPKDYRKGKCLYLSGESQVQVRWFGNIVSNLMSTRSHRGRCVGSLFVANQWYLSLWFVVYLWLSALVYIIRKYLHHLLVTYAAKVQRIFEISKKIGEKYKIQNTKLQKMGKWD